MPSSYVNNLRLEEMATGEKSGTWGTITNTNLELIGEALGYGTEAIATDADTTITMQDATADGVRALYLKITSGVSLTATRTVTLAPNTVSKVWIIENATTGSQSISISQGSGANVTVPNGAVKVIYTDGAGAGAAVTDALVDLDLASFSIAGTAVPSTAAELNILDGVTASTAELNYNDITTLGTVQASKTVTADANGDVLWGDSDKAIFGAGSDLQIYHDGTVSYIDDTGTGPLVLRANPGIDLQKYTGEYMVTCAADGAVTLYYDNAAKLATTSTGTSVTGTVTAINAATQDAMVVSGRAGGSSSYTVTLQPATLSASRSVTFPDGGGNYSVGYQNLPAVGTKTGSYTLAVADIGKYVQVGSGGSITIPDATFAEGDAISIFNNTTGDITITCSITTAYIAGTDSDVATATLATRGVATILFISSTVCVIAGNVS